MTDEEKQHLPAAVRIVSEAIDLAMQGRFPMGLHAAPTHMQIRSALEHLSDAVAVLMPPDKPEGKEP